MSALPICAGHSHKLSQIIREDARRWAVLGHVRVLDLPDCWVAAGFVRDAVWDHLHGYAPQLTGDVDVIWFDRAQTAVDVDRGLERRLLAADPSIRWSVKNQARMHIRNGDAPYLCATDAMRHWPETATAVAVRRDVNAGDAGERGADGGLAIAAPFGLEDLFACRLRAAGEFAGAKAGIFEERCAAKGWLARYPTVRKVVEF